MATLSTASRLCLLRSAAARKPTAPAAVRALSVTAMRPDSGASSSYTSPFRGGESKGNKIPDFGKYMSKGGEGSTKLFSYFMVGAMGAITAAGAKSTVQGTLCPFAVVVAPMGGADARGMQSFSSTCPRPPISWPWPRSRST